MAGNAHCPPKRSEGGKRNPGRAPERRRPPRQWVRGRTPSKFGQVLADMARAGTLAGLASARHYAPQYLNVFALRDTGTYRHMFTPL
jgi:hypothetical protein